jgi:hypothetical protein
MQIRGYRVVFYIFKTRRNELANKYKAEFNDLAEALQSNEIIIYCDQSRIVRNEADGEDEEDEYVDIIHNEVIDGSSVEDCAAWQASDDAIAAWTLEMDAVTVIQLCPWYLQLQLAGPSYITDALLNAAYQLSITPPGSPRPHPDIEGFSLLDQTILHEVCITGYILHRRQIIILRLMY